MPALVFQPTVQTRSGMVSPNVVPLPVYSGGTSFIAGELVKWDGTNFGIDRCGTNPTTTIFGIATCGSANASLYYLSRIPVIQLTPDDIVAISITGAYPNDTLIGNTYGVTRNSSGIWQLDFAKSASNQVCTVIDNRPTRLTSGGATLIQGQDMVFVKFLASALTADSIAS